MSDETSGPVTRTAATAAASAGDLREYTAEVRFGVVMYGGVSLAIYINGVTNEIFEMACATPRDGVFIDTQGEPFTRGIYRRLSWLVGNADLRRQYADAIRQAQARAGDGDPDDVWAGVETGGYTQTRFAVDVVAGTSAGGINGLFLAKALANGEQFAPLKDLWINEGDFALLLNDEKSVLDVEPRIVAQAQPASLLNSDRMYAKLHYALGKMTPMEGVRFDPGVSGTSPLVDEIDLFITTTDIKGSPVPLRLFDKVVYERRFKQNYHFTYPNGITPDSHNDFAVENRAFLAFAARCTSSFPFAFEPMTLDTLTRLKVAGSDPGVLRWNAFFPNLPRSEVDAGRHVSRAFGDGGYLDNKPFSYVVDTLSHRFAAVPMERKLLYVEPSPEHIDPDAPGMEPDPAYKPDPLQNSLAALTSIPQYETIREDLQAVLVRNRRIERIERVVRLGELSVKLFDPFLIQVKDQQTVPDWSSLKLSDMVRYYGTAFLPYQRLRVYALTDSIADRLCDGLQIGGDSDKQYALRAMVRVWRERNFHDEGHDDKPTINAFLDQFDLDYRLRRLAFTLRRIDKLTRLFHKVAAGPASMASGAGAPPEFSEEERQILDSLPEWYVKPGQSLTRERALGGERVLRVLKKGLLEVRERMQRSARDIDLSPPAGVEGDAIRKDLETILLDILGRAATGGAEIRSGTAAGTTPIVLDPQAARMASASRTLQESVVFRAQAIFHAADQVAETPIQRWLLGSIDAMRIKGAGSALLADRRDLEAASNAAWELLGTPTLVVETVEPAPGVNADRAADPPQETRKVVISVGDALADGLAAVDPQGLATVNGDDGLLIRQYLSRYYLRFDTYDQMSFPLYYDTGTGEPSTVEVVRISPVDATNLIDESAGTRKKLAGTALANFGAFLDRRWRLNDIMWGQLDGAERVIQAMLPMTDDDTRVVRKELIERAQRRILRDALVPEGEANLTSLVVSALDAAPGSGTTDEQLKKLFAELWTGNAAAQASMGTVLASLLSEPKLMEFVRNTRKTDPQPDPEMTMRSAARAVTITGRVLQAISKQHNAGEIPSRWIARLGLALQGIVAVSLPGTLNQRWWTHGIKVLYAFEVVLVALAFLFGSADMRTLAITALASTFGVHLLTLITGDLTRGRNRALHVATMAVLAAVVVLALVGGLVIFHQGAQQQLCWTHSADGSNQGAATWVCERTGWVHRTWSSIWNRGAAP